MKVPDIKGLVSIARGVLDNKYGKLQQVQQAEKGKTDKVELSSTSQTVFKIAAERPDTKSRADMVAQLKADYQNGNLSIEPRETAEAMLGSGVFDDIVAGK